jgi:hypothetical protein
LISLSIGAGTGTMVGMYPASDDAVELFGTITGEPRHRAGHDNRHS